MAIQFNSVSNEARACGFNILAGAGTPTMSATKGSLYIQTDAASTTSRLWINTDGSTTWTYFTSNA